MLYEIFCFKQLTIELRQVQWISEFARTLLTCSWLWDRARISTSALRFEWRRPVICRLEIETFLTNRKHGRLARWITWRACVVGEAKEGLENELWRRWSSGKLGEWAELDMHYQGSTYLSLLDKRKEWGSMSSPFLTEQVALWEYLSLHTQTHECCKFNF